MDLNSMTDDQFKELVGNPLIFEIFQAGISMKLEGNGIVIDGFYKCGEVVLRLHHWDTEEHPSKEIVAHQRYLEVDVIESVDDLVMLNARWLRRWNQKNPEHPSMPHSQFERHFIRLGLMTQENVSRYILKL